MRHNTSRLLCAAVLACLVSEALSVCLCTTANRVNVRNKPGTRSTIIGKANRGDCFTYLGAYRYVHPYYFIKVNFRGTAAYIVWNYLQLAPASRCSRRPQGTCASSETKLSHAAAVRTYLAPNKIPITSSGRCSNRHNKRCTSLEQIRCKAVRDLVQLKKDSGCYIRVTGGTEVGHKSGKCSHYNGHKIDIALHDCINKYIKKTFKYSGKRGTHLIYKDTRRNNVYYLERDHWDIKYNCQ